MAEVQNYNISTVSGGKPVLSRASHDHNNTVSNNKNVSILTRDQLNYIVPFSNQLKVYSLETRNCVKTIKFANHELLDRVFNAGDNTYVVDLIIGDIFNKDTTEKLVTLVSNKGHVIVLNYKGKLQRDLKCVSLTGMEGQSENGNENIVKFCHNDDSTKILTVQCDKNNKYNYRLYSVELMAQRPMVCENKWENVILINWSNDDNTIVLLQNKDKAKQFVVVQNVLNKVTQLVIPFSNVYNDKAMSVHNTTSHPLTINKFVTALAIDNSATQLAIGFASGVITMVHLHDNMDNNNLDLRYLKWHIDSVLSLTFNDDSSYLLSGGWEKVMVFWQLSTNQQQFLPRLNGIIVDSQVISHVGGSLYSITLQLSDNKSNNDYQIMVLNSLDLTSRLSVLGPIPCFQDQLPFMSQPVSTQDLNSSNLAILKRHYKKILKMSPDFTTPIEIHPVTKQLYIPHSGQLLQRFDFYKNESTNLQILTDGVNQHMGKVRTELTSIADPMLKQLKLSPCGKWMITYEIEPSPRDILSSNDLIHILKFWKLHGENWELKTKVMNPHGANVPIVTMCVGPDDKVTDLLTADNNGGVKYWSFDQYENNWCLKKILISNFNHFSNSVSLQFARDRSLIFHSFDDKLQIIDFNNFKIWSPPMESQMVNEYNMDSPIQCLQLINETKLIVMTLTSLLVLDLLLGKFVNGFDLYPFIKDNFKNGHHDRLISCDVKNDRFILVINERLNGKNKLNWKATVMVFNADLTHQLGKFNHDQYISWIGWNHDTDFIFLDIDSKLGIVSTTMNTEIADEVNKEGVLDGLSLSLDGEVANNTIPQNNDYLDELRKLAINKQKPISQSNNNKNTEEDPMEQDIIDGERNSTMINMNSFSNMFENIQNISMNTLFENVIKTLN